MKTNFEHYLEQKKDVFLNELGRYIHDLNIPSRLKDSMIYSLEAGGKRIRPILLMASNEAYESRPEKIYSSAVALEMIHTYSLIHDDLPAMDNDDYRRGKLTNHKQFDEATAILAGDGLLTYSFSIIANDPNLADHEKVHIIQMLSKASGPEGMVAGQVLDMEAEQSPVNLTGLEEIHALKTGELLSFAVEIGAYLGDATEEELQYLKEFSYYLGLIFQVQDDLLDEFGDPEKLGKPVGSDVGNDKSTYPKLLTPEGAISKKTEYLERAESALLKAHAADSALAKLMNYISKRDR
ncbi:MAG TPA: farnesyl diphosphate synthase [Virgibacillus sp.]|nr:farnesyl diphosphate synthase [Virgibacillus sp.]